MTTIGVEEVPAGRNFFGSGRARVRSARRADEAEGR
jgi:hypothetical protein